MGQRLWIGGIVILASWEFHFIRVHENLVQHPSNYISILTLFCLFFNVLWTIVKLLSKIDIFCMFRQNSGLLYSLYVITINLFFSGYLCLIHINPSNTRKSMLLLRKLMKK